MKKAKAAALVQLYLQVCHRFDAKLHCCDVLALAEQRVHPHTNGYRKLYETYFNLPAIAFFSIKINWEEGCVEVKPSFVRGGVDPDEHVTVFYLV